MSDQTYTIAQAQEWARAQGIDRLDVQLILTHLLGQSRTWLMAHDQDLMPDASLQPFKDWIARRASGEPFAYLTGDKEFFGLPLSVNPSVLIPRPDTEILVEWALEHIPIDASFKALDLGTGSGAIALALAHQRPKAHITAVDASEMALQTAQANAEQLGLKVEFLQGSWFTPVAGQIFDLIVSNPPYIAEGDPHLAALKHEPITALTSGPDGLDDIRAIILAAREHLLPGAWLLLEHGYDQAVAVADLLQTAGYQNIQTRKDLGGQDRCTGGQTL